MAAASQQWTEEKELELITCYSGITSVIPVYILSLAKEKLKKILGQHILHPPFPPQLWKCHNIVFVFIFLLAEQCILGCMLPVAQNNCCPVSHHIAR